ncbi:MAG: hypothetical protein B7Z31_04835 [Rhodobacterales bacterium 12-65-15]|nr:MAG: hypothetical protein B7Z31_04835 [Rhodobacterales bacterium 12-65-15]
MPPKPLSSTYRDKLIARFGRVPSMAELAKLESATHRMSLEIYRPVTALDKSIEARRSRTKETIGQLVAALTRPMTNQDLATATGIHLSTVCHLMLRALDEGAVKRERIQRMYVWERADSPDKPPALPPIRGVVYATIAAAAKALDVNAATVRRAFKRGTQNNIGLGRQPGFKGTPRWAKTS